MELSLSLSLSLCLILQLQYNIVVIPIVLPYYSNYLYSTLNILNMQFIL